HLLVGEEAAGRAVLVAGVAQAEPAELAEHRHPGRGRPGRVRAGVHVPVDDVAGAGVTLRDTAVEPAVGVHQPGRVVVLQTGRDAPGLVEVPLAPALV